MIHCAGLDAFRAVRRHRESFMLPVVAVRLAVRGSRAFCASPRLAFARRPTVALSTRPTACSLAHFTSIDGEATFLCDA